MILCDAHLPSGPCGMPAVYKFGIIRNCGCDSSPVRYGCAYCVSPSVVKGCNLCETDGCVTLTEPVRI